MIRLLSLMCRLGKGRVFSQASLRINEFQSRSLHAIYHQHPAQLSTQLVFVSAIMTYLVGELLKEIAAGGPITSFPKSFKGPPMLEKEKEAMYLEERKMEAAKQAMNSHEEPREDWVKKKWARYYVPNKVGEIKPNFNMMTYGQFEEYMADAQYQGRCRDAEASNRMSNQEPEVLAHAPTTTTKVAHEPSQTRKGISSVAGLHTVTESTKDCPRKKPRVKAYINKDAYLQDR